MITLAAHAYVAPTSIIAVIGIVATRTFRRPRAPTGSSPPPRPARSGAMLRFRPSRPGGGEWEPARIAVSELRADGLRRWPSAPGVYLAHDDTIHCRDCVDDHHTRASIVSGRDSTHRALVLFGGPTERALVDANCATHRPPPPTAHQPPEPAEH